MKILKTPNLHSTSSQLNIAFQEQPPSTNERSPVLFVETMFVEDLRLPELLLLLNHPSKVSTVSKQKVKYPFMPRIEMPYLPTLAGNKNVLHPEKILMLKIVFVRLDEEEKP